MNFLSLIPARVWEYLLVAGLALAVIGGAIHHERKVGAAKVEAVRAAEHAAAEKAASAAITANHAETTRREVALKEVSDEAQRLSTRAVDDAADARAAGDRLLDRAARRGPAASDPQAAPGSPPAADGAGVPTDLLRGVITAAERYAEIADKRGIAGQACERDADALTPAAQ